MSNIAELQGDKNRSRRINVRLTDDMHDRVELLSQEMGLPASTLCAIAVSEYVINKERVKQQFEAQITSNERIVAEKLEEIFGNEQLQALIASSTGD